jgi:hypothetical protein
MAARRGCTCNRYWLKHGVVATILKGIGPRIGLRVVSCARFEHADDVGQEASWASDHVINGDLGLTLATKIADGGDGDHIAVIAVHPSQLP